MKRQISCFIGSNEHHYLNNLRQASSNRFSAGDIIGYALKQLELRDTRDVLSSILFESLDNQDSMTHIEEKETLQANQTITDSMTHIEVKEPLQVNQTITTTATPPDTMTHIEPQYLKLPELDKVMLEVSLLCKTSQERVDYLNKHKIYNAAKSDEVWRIQDVVHCLNNAKTREKKNAKKIER